MESSDRRPSDARGTLAVLARGTSPEGPWLVVEKPSGWHTLSGRSDGPTVEDALRSEHPECGLLSEAGLVHRLDLETSGCLLASTSAEGRLAWRERWQGRSGGPILKTYLARAGAAAELGPDGDRGEFTLYFRSRYRRSAKVTVDRSGREAEQGRCRWRMRRRDALGTLLEIELVGPGKRHQIRAGLAALGAPLLGDTLYGGAAAARINLHAWRLEFDDVLVESPPPAW